MSNAIEFNCIFEILPYKITSNSYLNNDNAVSTTFRIRTLYNYVCSEIQHHLLQFSVNKKLRAIPNLGN